MPIFVIADFSRQRADEAALREILGPPKRAPLAAETMRAACADAAVSRRAALEAGEGKSDAETDVLATTAER